MSATGALILAFFATVWWVVGLRAAAHGPALVYLAPFIVAVGLIGVFRAGTRRRHTSSDARDLVDAAEEARRDRLVSWASALEGVAIFIAANILANTGHRDAIAPAVALIVGAHFIPLAKRLPAPAYYATAAALIALGAVGLVIADLSTRLTVVSVGSALVLWSTALSVLRRGSAPRTDALPPLQP